MDFINEVTAFSKEAPEIDLGIFDDELVYQIDWTPLAHGETNFTAYRLAQSLGTSRIKSRFKTTL